MTLVVLWMGALITAWVQHELGWPWWIWLGYAACAVWAVVTETASRQERTMTFHAVQDLLRRSERAEAERPDPTVGGRALLMVLALAGTAHVATGSHLLV